ncbi:competence protein ComEA [Pseudomonas sp. HAR-UPW-AIA-41]|uniref:ComEA family DNA-binding protein n=1 Tax=Pseudomonas sp. HAR-UPW-AIA-41 TaxID=1985301 RepID=UPI000BB38375|nr:ComEA family DNA-binding protein [Pseudomonas sp. HAR-UPW-AIA-41]PAV49643.1 competence protein ComEA [Pseudomonas sp. HAR-UPW-AIA-41]
MRKTAINSLVFAVISCSSLFAAASETAAPVPAAVVQTQSASESAQTSLININTADAVTLDRELNGIGAVKAKAIVEYRDANGPFASVDELLEVKGIGAATLEKNRDKLGVN